MTPGSPSASGPIDGSGPDHFDLFDPDVQRWPFDTYASLRQLGPVRRLGAVDESAPPTFVISRFDEASEVLRDHRRFSSKILPLPVMLFLDPPEHDRIRQTVSRAFTPRAVDTLEPRVAAIASQLVAAFVAGGFDDVVDGLTGILPVSVIGEVLGVPVTDWARLREWSHATVRSLAAAGAPGDEAQAAMAGALSLHQYLSDLVDNLAPSEDGTIAQRLVAAQGREEIDRAELIGFLQFLFVAGHETTTALLSHVIEVLARDTELQSLVRSERSLLGPLIEEVLRTTGPLQRLFRVAIEDVTVGGTTMPAGSTVVVLIGSANRDDRQFPAGDDLDLSAADRSHVAFGKGVHYCLGAPLARLESRLAINRLLDALGPFVLDPSRPPRRFAGGTTSELQTEALWIIPVHGDVA